MVSKDDVEKRPSPVEGVETRRVGDVNPDTETKTKVGEVAEGVDDATRDLIVHDTTTRERTTVAKRSHEPLDLDAAEEDQPAEDGNGPRAAEVNPGQDPITSTSPLVVSEEQVKAGVEARTGETGGDSAAAKK